MASSPTGKASDHSKVQVMTRDHVPSQPTLRHTERAQVEAVPEWL